MADEAARRTGGGAVAHTFRALLPGRAPYSLTLRPYRITGLWAAEGSHGPTLARGTAAEAAATIATRWSWPDAAVAALRPAEAR